LNCQAITEAVADFCSAPHRLLIVGLSLCITRTLICTVSKPYITAQLLFPYSRWSVIISWFGIDIYSKIALAFLSTVSVAHRAKLSGRHVVEKTFLALDASAGAPGGKHSNWSWFHHDHLGLKRDEVEYRSCNSWRVHWRVHFIGKEWAT